MRWIGSQAAPDTHLDHLEMALIRVAARASALIEQSRREVERSRVLLKDDRGRARNAQVPVT
jgi:hypothetical protein